MNNEKPYSSTLTMYICTLTVHLCPHLCNSTLEVPCYTPKKKNNRKHTHNQDERCWIWVWAWASCSQIETCIWREIKGARTSFNLSLLKYPGNPLPRGRWFYLTERKSEKRRAAFESNLGADQVISTSLCWLFFWLVNSVERHPSATTNITSPLPVQCEVTVVVEELLSEKGE